MSRDTSLPEPRLEMMPLIDVVFLLLTFFVFAMVLSARLEVTEIALPQASAGSEALEVARYVILALTEEGELTLEGESLEWEQAGEAIAQALSGGEAAGLGGEGTEGEVVQLLVAPDRRSPSGELFRLVDLLQELKIGNLKFLREPGEAAGQSEPVGP